MINNEKLKIQEEAFEALKEVEFRGACILPTGTGKTYVLIKALKEVYKEGMSILYGCDNSKLRDEDFPNELKKWDAENFIDIIERKCYQSTYKFENRDYDIFLCDEGDYMLTPEYIKVLENNNFRYIIFVSATLEGEKRKMLENHLPVVYEKTMSDIDGQGIVNKAQLYAVNFMLTPEENRKYLSFNDNFSRALNGDARRTKGWLTIIQRTRKLFLSKLDSAATVCKNLMKKLYLEREDNKILVFCNTAEQADRITKYSYHTGNEKDNDVIQRFDEGDLRVAAVIGKIDRGVNLNGVNNEIFESPGQSKTKFTQKSGRGRRLNINDILHIFFLIPFYKDRRGNVKPTIVQKWVLDSTKELNQPIQNYKL